MPPVQLPLGERPRILGMAWATQMHPVERWYLPERWCLHIYDYDADLLVDGVALRLKPGDVTLLPAGTHQEYRYHQDPARHLFCHFVPGGGGTAALVPMQVDPGADGPRFLADLDEAWRDHQMDRLRAEVRLWDLLWRLVRLGKADRDGDRPPTLRKVLLAIEDGLGRPLSVADLAAQHGLSHNALTRQFRAHLGTTAVAWIRRRRAERAWDLLRHTDLTAAEVAGRIGVTDAHHLNRLLREVLGHGPQELRRRSGR